MFRNCYIKKISLFIISIFCIWSLDSCKDVDNKDVDKENVPEYYENMSDESLSSNSPQVAPFIFINSNLKVTTNSETSKNIDLTFNKTLMSFPVDDDSQLSSFTMKEILEMYSDFSQKINFTITRIIYASLENYNYYLYPVNDSSYYTKLSEEVILSKEDTLGYFINDNFAKDWLNIFSISIDDLKSKNEKYFTVTFILTITPSDNSEIKLLRPASSKEVNGYLSDTAILEGINVGDLVSYIYFKNGLEKSLSNSNYVKLYVEEGKIQVLQYDKNLVNY